MTTKFIKISVILLSGLSFFASCDSWDRPDVSGIEVDLSIDRFEQDLFGLDNFKDTLDISGMLEQYPEFFPLFVERMMQMGKLDDSVPRYQQQLQLFLFDPMMRQLYDTCTKKFNDVTFIEEELVQAFRYYKHYFPKEEVPRVVTFVSQFGFAAVSSARERLSMRVDSQ